MAHTDIYKDDFSWDFIAQEIKKKFLEELDKALKKQDEQDEKDAERT